MDFKSLSKNSELGEGVASRLMMSVMMMPPLLSSWDSMIKKSGRKEGTSKDEGSSPLISLLAHLSVWDTEKRREEKKVKWIICCLSFTGCQDYPQDQGREKGKKKGREDDGTIGVHLFSWWTVKAEGKAVENSERSRRSWLSLTFTFSPSLFWSFLFLAAIFSSNIFISPPHFLFSYP